MADSAALSDLLDRASHVFSLAGKLGRAFHEQGQSPVVSCDAAIWQSLSPTFDEFCESLLDLRNAMQDPPAGFAPVAEYLVKTARVAKCIRDSVERNDIFMEYLDYYPELNTLAEAGFRAVREVVNAARLNDPFAFLDEHAAGETAAGNKVRIDTTPTLPEPPAALVEAAAQDIPRIMANVQPQHDGAIELVASHLAKRLQDAGHTLAAAHWAVHRAVRAGWLQAGLIEVELPSFGQPVPGTMRLAGRPRHRPMKWTGGGKATMAIPEGKPAPYDNFKVTATDLMWAWWRSSANDDGSHSEPAVTSGERSELHQPPVQTDPEVKAAGDAQNNHGGGPPAAEGQAESKPKRRGRKKADYETVQREAKIADDWSRARDSGILKAEFAKGIEMTLKQLDALLNRVAKRKSRLDK